MEHKNLMIMGTASGVGKSLVTLGLCRIMYKDGYSVAPFKSQNMALNSCITEDGDEIGKGQGLQSLACGLQPKYYMNPILLKPVGNGKIQLIINGKLNSIRTGDEYNKGKYLLKDILRESYRKIREKYRYSIIEGAGSPVEINIKEEDISNMGMARIANSPVILVADIDRGGVFASIYGTLLLLDEEDRKRVKGVIINKFRGNLESFKKSLVEVEKKLGIEFLGVLPYEKIDIEAEDGLSEELKREKDEKSVKISIVKSKYSSNLGDFYFLDIYKNIQIKYVENKNELGEEDIIIIPESDNVIDDFLELKKRGIIEDIIKENNMGKKIIAIGEGNYILYKCGLIDIDGSFFEKNELINKYFHKFFGEYEGVKILGYKAIYNENEFPSFIINNNIIGTFIHKIFQNKNFIEKLTEEIMKNKNIQKDVTTFEEYREREFDKAEALLRKNIDIEKIYKIINGEL